MRYISFITLLLFSLYSYSQEGGMKKNSFNLRAEFMGIPVEDTGPFGALLSVGYEIFPFPRKTFFSIESRVGGGGFGGMKKEEANSGMVYKYVAGCYSLGIAPKFYLPLFDDEIDLFLENEFAFMSSFITIHDYNITQSRSEKDLFRFYYNCRVGALFHLKKTDVSCWVGFTTFDLTQALNRNLPMGRHRFPEQRSWVCYGIGMKI